MPLGRSLLLLLLLTGVSAVIWTVPTQFGLSAEASTLWFAVMQICGPLLACVLCNVAAWRSKGREAMAWRYFAAGSTLYLIGNSAYIGMALAGVDMGFPTTPELAFFLMAALFALGIAAYGQSASSAPRTVAYSFLLLYGATIFGLLFLLRHAISQSTMDPLATIVAFAYPALWLSVAVFALSSLALYNQHSRTLPLLLLTCGIAAEASADFIYALKLMAGAYEVGGITQLLWLVSQALICLAAWEHLTKARREDQAISPRRAHHRLVQATTPALALCVILLAGSVAGAFGGGFYQWFSGALAIGLSVVVLLREYSILNLQDNLYSFATERADRLADSERRLASVLESTSDSVVVVDRDWKVRYFNDRALVLVPDLAERGVGADYWSLFTPDERSHYEAFFRSAVAEQEARQVEAYSRIRGVWLDLRVYPSRDGLSIFFRDVSEQRRAREEIEYLAHYDFLTGIYGRGVFQRKLDEALASQAGATILLMDIDHFKQTNDSLGHAVGDALLSAVAAALKNCLMPGELVARLGGDEFAILCQASDASRAGEVAGRALQVFSRPFQVDQHMMNVTASIGIAVAAPGLSREDLLKQADIALYEAKAQHRGGSMIFRPEMQERLHERQALLRDLALAAERGELELHYQPLLDIRTATATGFEALLRWRHPVRGLVPPDAFIPAAEEAGLIVPIGEWVLRTACMEAASWPSSIGLSVNLSTRQLEHEPLIDRLVEILVESGLDHSRLELEVTESALMQEANLATLKQIQDLGVGLALDDFGTGFSSLSYLQRFQFNKLKIDRSFIAGVPHKKQSTAIISSVADLAHALGILVTAEGVETEEQAEWLSAHCDQLQGYLIARPMIGSAARTYIQSELARATTPARKRSSMT